MREAGGICLRRGGTRQMARQAADQPAERPGAHRSVTVGILWMILSCALLSAVAVLGREAALEGVPLFQIVLLRLAFAAVAFTPMLAWRGVGMARTAHLRLYLVRVAIGFVGMTTWFLALSLTTVGEVQAIGFLTPLFATIGAWLILHEAIGWRRWTAILVGFAGAMVILRPGIGAASLGTWVAVAAALGMAASSIFIKQLADRDHPDTVVLVTTLMQCVVALGPGLAVWQPLDAGLWVVFAAMGALGMLGHIALARAFRAADASIVMGVDFARLPFAVLFGWLAFGELIDFWTWVGAGIIFGAALYTARRERRLARAGAAPQKPRVRAGAG
jgi:drug/metabolite transporter (DMT)-like permease